MRSCRRYRSARVPFLSAWRRGRETAHPLLRCARSFGGKVILPVVRAEAQRSIMRCCASAVTVAGHRNLHRRRVDVRHVGGREHNPSTQPPEQAPARVRAAWARRIFAINLSGQGSRSLERLNAAFLRPLGSLAWRRTALGAPSVWSCRERARVAALG